MKKIKILYVADTAPPKKDGVVRFMMETSSRINPVLFDVSFLLPSIPGAEEFAEKEGLEATFVPIRKFEVATYPPAIPKSKIVKKTIRDADVIFVNSIAPLGGSALKYADKIGKPVVEFIHSVDWRLFAYATKFPDKYSGTLKPIVRRLYNKSDLLLVASRSLKTLLRSSKVRTKMKVIPLGVDSSKFTEDRVSRLRIRKKLKLKNKFVIGYHGRLSREKNISLLLKAYSIVKRKIPSARLLLIGDGPKRKLAKKEGVICTGFVNNPEDYLQAVDVYVLPSMTETTALSLMEAMACGLPCIATNVGAIPSYLEDRINGILVDKEELDQNIVAFGIKKLYGDVGLRRKIKRNAKDTISKYYNWENTTKKLQRVFKSIAKD